MNPEIPRLRVINPGISGLAKLAGMPGLHTELCGCTYSTAATVVLIVFCDEAPVAVFARYYHRYTNNVGAWRHLSLKRCKCNQPLNPLFGVWSRARWLRCAWPEFCYRGRRAGRRVQHWTETDSDRCREVPNARFQSTSTSGSSVVFRYTEQMAQIHWQAIVKFLHCRFLMQPLSLNLMQWSSWPPISSVTVRISLSLLKLISRSSTWMPRWTFLSSRDRQRRRGGGVVVYVHASLQPAAWTNPGHYPPGHNPPGHYPPGQKPPPIFTRT